MHPINTNQLPKTIKSSPENQYTKTNATNQTNNAAINKSKQQSNIKPINIPETTKQTTNTHNKVTSLKQNQKNLMIQSVNTRIIKIKSSQ